MESPDEPEAQGSEILRHEARERPWQPAEPSDEHTIGAIERHIERYFGPVGYVWHEVISDLIHLDVHVIEPTPARPHFTLVTSGMSDRPMTVPEGKDSSRHVELMLCLPADWPMNADAWGDDNAYWPVRLLKTVARLPHEHDTWIAAWHSIPNGDPAEPYAPDTPFVGVLVAPMLGTDAEARTITADDGRQISLLALVPLHPAEMELKVARGMTALLGAFDRAGVNELLDPARPSAV